MLPVFGNSKAPIGHKRIETLLYCLQAQKDKEDTDFKEENMHLFLLTIYLLCFFGNQFLNSFALAHSFNSFASVL